MSGMSDRLLSEQVEELITYGHNVFLKPEVENIMYEIKKIESELETLHKLKLEYDERWSKGKEENLKLESENQKLKEELDFIHEEYGKEKNENLTKDALWLKIASLECRLAEAEKLYQDREHYTLAALGEAFIKIMEVE